jgi:hypothetical protein
MKKYQVLTQQVITRTFEVNALHEEEAHTLALSSIQSTKDLVDTEESEQFILTSHVVEELDPRVAVLNNDILSKVEEFISAGDLKDLSYRQIGLMFEQLASSYNIAHENYEDEEGSLFEAEKVLEQLEAEAHNQEQLEKENPNV